MKGTKAKRIAAGCGIVVFLICACAGMMLLYKKAMSLYHKVYDLMSEQLSMTYRVLDEIKTEYELDYSWAEDTEKNLIAHAFGGLEGEYSYTNSLEAFESNYAAGFRVFEVDFDLTNDDEAVAVHEESNWRSITGADENTAFTYENFMGTPIYDRFTPMDYRQVVDLMAQYPDIYIITDTKRIDNASLMLELSSIVHYAQETAPEVLDRIIIQIYGVDMIDLVMDLYPFKSVIYTLYRAHWTDEDVLEFCKRSGVRFVTMPESIATPERVQALRDQGVLVGTHTVNDLQKAMEQYEMGVTAIYTDFIQPADVLKN